MRIDAHQHFWQYNSQSQVWIDESMVTIQRHFTPEQLKPILDQNNIQGCIAVQVDQTPAETQFLLDLAGQHDFIKGVLGWVDLQSANLEMQLENYAQQPNLKGFRHILQAETPEFMLQKSFVNGIKTIGKYNYTYDILIYPEHLPAALELVKQCSTQKFVIDHLAKPAIKAGKIKDWEVEIRKIAELENVCCKLSGLVTEANWQTWTLNDLKPYLDVAFDSFGPDRLLFGSDWPVCLLAGKYQEVLQAIECYIERLSTTEKVKIMGLNAVDFYNLS
jgi:L-fuconolactonase